MATINIDENLLLRAYEIDDFTGLFEAINSSRQHLGPWLSWVANTTKPEHSFEFIRQAQHKRHVQEALALGIFYEGAIIGGVGMHEWAHETKRAQVGYWLCKDFEGRGLMTRVLAAFLEYLFTVTALNKIEIHYVPANIRSARVAQKLGFRIEGLIRQSTIRNGMPDDIVVTGLLKDEWRSGKK